MFSELKLPGFLLLFLVNIHLRFLLSLEFLLYTSESTYLYFPSCDYLELLYFYQYNKYLGFAFLWIQVFFYLLLLGIHILGILFLFMMGSNCLFFLSWLLSFLFVMRTRYQFFPWASGFSFFFVFMFEVTVGIKYVLMHRRYTWKSLIW